MSAAVPLTLVSHKLCPYVQRAAIVLLEKGVPFERRDVDVSNKPAWFLGISPLGKTPVLLAGDEPVFESAVICEYLDETQEPQLHPAGALRRAQHRAWMEFGSAVLNTIWAYYTAPDDAALAARAGELKTKFAQLEPVLDAKGPFFQGEAFCLVDAVFAPVFRYLDAFEAIGEPPLLEGLPRLQAWRQALAARPSVRKAVAANYPDLLRAFLIERGSARSQRMLTAA
jgi:glutathione S-transferase